MNGIEEVRRKLNSSYTAESYNTPEVQQLLAQRMKEGTDYLGRDFTFKLDESDHPRWLKENRDKFMDFYKMLMPLSEITKQQFLADIRLQEKTYSKLAGSKEVKISILREKIMKARRKNNIRYAEKLEHTLAETLGLTESSQSLAAE